MKFQAGDQVSFINEKQTGTVLRVLRNGLVVVAIEEGFEIPVQATELILIHRDIPADIPESKPGQLDKADGDNNSFEQLCGAGCVCLSAVPEKTGAVLTGPVEYFLVNNSDTEILYTFHMRTKNEWIGLQRGSCAAQSHQFLVKRSRSDWQQARSIVINLLPYPEAGIALPQSIRHELAIMLPGIQESRNLPGRLSFARTIQLTAISNEGPPDFTKLVEKFRQPHTESKPDAALERTPSPKFVGNDRGTIETEQEVDLHFEELVSDPGGWSHDEMIAIQMRRFTDVMYEAIRKRLRKIIFIHGVGSGRLKNEIRKELAQYRGVKFRDADPARYGKGATEVNLTDA